MKICGIISGGNYSPLDKIGECDFIIACDKGYEYALYAAVKPDLIIGDFDSYTGQLPDDIGKIVLPVEKNDTDTMVAFRYAVKEGFDEIYLYCANGGRFDHLMGNINACTFAAKNNVKVTVIDERDLIYFISNNSVKIPEMPGYSISVLSVTDVSKNVCEKGVKYVLDNVVMNNTEPLGVSNEWNGTAEISVGEGVLMVILSKMPGE